MSHEKSYLIDDLSSKWYGCGMNGTYDLTARDLNARDHQKPKQPYRATTGRPC